MIGTGGFSLLPQCSRGGRIVGRKCREGGREVRLKATDEEERTTNEKRNKA